MNKLDQDYKRLCEYILDAGNSKTTRNGDVLSIFGYTIRHKMSDGFPILTTKKMAFKSIVAELLWFLNGRTDLRWLLEENCHIWSGDFYKRYVDKTSDNSSDWNQWMKYNPDGSTRMFTLEEFEDKILTDNRFNIMWGSGGNIYGKQWRNTGGKQLAFKMKDFNGNDFPNQEPIPGIDQIQNLIDTLKTNPDDRRMIVNSWNVSDLKDMLLPPCHYSFQVYTREFDCNERLMLLTKLKSFDPLEIGVGLNIPEEHIHSIADSYNVPKREISLLFNMRSCDLGLGWPYNIASYGLLLLILARQVNMIPGELISNLGDCHIYEEHIQGLTEQMSRIPYNLPTLKIKDGVMHDISEYTVEDFKVENYKSHGKIYLPLKN